MFLEIVFCTWPEGFLVVIFRLFFFHLAAKLIGPLFGCEFFKNVDFSAHGSLKFDLLLKGGVCVFGDSFLHLARGVSCRDF